MISRRDRKTRDSVLYDAKTISRFCAETRERYTKSESTEPRDRIFEDELVAIRDNLALLVIGDERQLLNNSLHSSVVSSLLAAHDELKALLEADPINADIDEVDALLFTIWHQAVIIRGVLLNDNEYTEYRR